MRSLPIPLRLLLAAQPKLVTPLLQVVHRVITRHLLGQAGLKTEEEAIALANDSDFGLAGSVWTKDEARGKRVASQIDTGMMFVNNIDWADADLPFGGIKNSGYGRELGSMGIQEFVNKKLVRSGAIVASI